MANDMEDTEEEAEAAAAAAAAVVDVVEVDDVVEEARRHRAAWSPTCHSFTRRKSNKEGGASLTG